MVFFLTEDINPMKVGVMQISLKMQNALWIIGFRGTALGVVYPKWPDAGIIKCESEAHFFLAYCPKCFYILQTLARVQGLRSDRGSPRTILGAFAPFEESRYTLIVGRRDQ
jgi:hypothetical protein